MTRFFFSKKEIQVAKKYMKGDPLLIRQIKITMRYYLTPVRMTIITPWTAAYQAPLSMDFPGKSTEVGCHCLLQLNR